MDNVIKLRDRAALFLQLSKADDPEREEFLFNEGLEVLADYRAIPDENTRLAVKQLIQNLAGRPHSDDETI